MPRSRHRWASSQSVQTYNPFCAVLRLFKLSIIVLKLQRDAIVDLEEEGELTGNTLVSLASGEYKAGKLEMTACIIALATTTQPQCPSSAPPTRSTTRLIGRSEWHARWQLRNSGHALDELFEFDSLRHVCLITGIRCAIRGKNERGMQASVVRQQRQSHRTNTQPA